VNARWNNTYDRLHISGWTSYTVQPGDTLYGLWQRFDARDDRWLVVQQIEKKNGLGSSTIRPGEVIQVPEGRYPNG
jgi:LysM repeat protein